MGDWDRSVSLRLQEGVMEEARFELGLHYSATKIIMLDYTSLNLNGTPCFLSCQTVVIFTLADACRVSTFLQHNKFRGPIVLKIFSIRNHFLEWQSTAILDAPEGLSWLEVISSRRKIFNTSHITKSNQIN